MAKENEGRIHGDSHIWKDSFDRPISENERVLYEDLLTTIMNRADLDVVVNANDPDLPQALLALRQRMEVGFSNGCPFPEKGINEFLMEQEEKPKSLKEVAELLRKSAIPDGNHSMLFQLLLKKSSVPLKDELLSYHSPWEKIKDQEDWNLPENITDPEGRGAYGLAFDPPYFESIIPLMKYIKESEDPNSKFEDRFWKVMEFFENTAGQANSIEELITKTEEFINVEKSRLQK